MTATSDLAVSVEVPGVGPQVARGTVAAMICWLLANADDFESMTFATLTLHIAGTQLSPCLERHYPKVQLR